MVAYILPRCCHCISCFPHLLLVVLVCKHTYVLLRICCRCCLNFNIFSQTLFNNNHVFLLCFHFVFLYNRYSVCLRRESGSCCARFSPCPDLPASDAFGLAGDPSSALGGAQHKAATDDLCHTEDHIAIPGFPTFFWTEKLFLPKFKINKRLFPEKNGNML